MDHIATRVVPWCCCFTGKCKFDQGSYTVTCTWKKLKAKQTVRIKATGVKPGPTTNTAVVNFNGGTATSSVDIMVNVSELLPCCCLCLELGTCLHSATR